MKEMAYYPYNNPAETDENIKSEYNEASFQISRLHNIWCECKNLREHGKLMALRWKLDTATIELWNDAKRLKREKEITDIDSKIIEAIKKNDMPELYMQLVEKEKALRNIQDAAGKGAKYGYGDEELL